MTKSRFFDRLNNSVLLFDGAIGTMLYSRGMFINRCYDELNLSMPDLVKEIHTAYVAAGADCIETNTFGANRVKLTSHGFGEKLYDINFQGARLAKEVAGTEILVAGSMGPLGTKIEPWGSVSKEDARNVFKEQAQALKDGGIDLFILETFTSLTEIQYALSAVREVSADMPVIASLSVRDDGNLIFGTRPESYMRTLEDCGADVIGLNCSVGPHYMLETLEALVKLTHKPISVMPNAGVPRIVEGRSIYLTSADYMGEYARRFIQVGAKIIGGCCGTTEHHIKLMRKAITSIIPQTREVAVKTHKVKEEKVEALELGHRSHWGKKLAAGEFVTTVEITPPRGCEPGRILEAAQKLKDAHVDAVNIPDGPRALTRMSAQHLSILIQQQVGIEPVLHYTCRDRNLLGMMSDMLGLSAVGIHNLLLITGDPPKMGDFPDATAVFDVDSIGLTQLVNNLNHGIDLGGNSIGKPTHYVKGVGINPCAIDIKTEIDRLEQKVKAGADFAITQPVFDVNNLLNFLEKIKHLGIPVIAGIWPLISLRNAEFMNNEVPGVTVPAEIIERMRAAKTKEDAIQEGIEIARQMVRNIRHRVQGVQVSAPFGKVSYAIDVLEALK